MSSPRVICGLCPTAYNSRKHECQGNVCMRVYGDPLPFLIRPRRPSLYIVDLHESFVEDNIIENTIVPHPIPECPLLSLKVYDTVSEGIVFELLERRDDAALISRRKFCEISSCGSGDGELPGHLVLALL